MFRRRKERNASDRELLERVEKLERIVKHYTKGKEPSYDIVRCLSKNPYLEATVTLLLYIDGFEYEINLIEPIYNFLCLDSGKLKVDGGLAYFSIDDFFSNVTYNFAIDYITKTYVYTVDDIRKEEKHKESQTCSIKIPEKKEEIELDVTHSESVDLGFARGWNACIDAILSGSEVEQDE